MSNTITPTVFYRTLNVTGLEIFYREAGPRDAPTVLLLHGFPSSSHMFHNLIPMLADTYHVVAPDFPGYGESSAPSVNDFDYSYERFATVTETFTRAPPRPPVPQGHLRESRRSAQGLVVAIREQTRDGDALGRDDFVHGKFGENFTLDGLPDDDKDQAVLLLSDP